MFSKRVSVRLVGSLAGVAALFACDASAQETQPGGQTAVELPAVTVTTANKRPQRIQPAAVAPSSGTEQQTATLATGEAGTPGEAADANVSVRSAAELRAAGVEKVANLEKVFPGLTIRSRGNRAYANFTVRGMSSPDFYNPSVQVLIDGVPQAAAAFTQDLVDVERVEFLRGPQSVLYGANAFGGVLNIITRKPRETTAAASGTVSNLKSSAQASATGVLAPGTTFLDVAIKREWDRGEIDDLSTGRSNVDTGDLLSGRASLRYAPANGPFDATLTVAREHLKSREEMYLFDEFLKRRDFFSAQQGPYPLLDRDTQTASLLWNYRFGGFTLTSISAYQDVDLGRSFPSITALGPLGISTPEAEKAFSQEVRLAYGGKGPLSGVVGAYFRDSDFQRTGFALAPFLAASHNKVKSESFAAFGDVTWRFAPKWDATAGVRASHDRAAINFDQPDPNFFPPVASAFAFSNSASFDSVQPKFSLGYQLNEGTRAYVLVSQGYKPGGFQHAVSTPADVQPYNPETAWNYEAGLRTSLFGRSLDVAAAVYHIVSQDKQIYVGQIGQQVIRNAGEAESTGLELEAQWRATRQLTVLATANIGRSKFTDFVDPIVPGVVYTGKRVPYAPDLTANLHIRYLLEQRLLGASVTLLGGMRFASKSYFDEGNTLAQGAFATYDAALDLSWDNGVALKLFANNITDEIYREYSFASGPQVFSIPSEGRMVGMTLSAKY